MKLVVLGNFLEEEEKLAHFLETEVSSLVNVEGNKLFLAIEYNEVVGYIFYKKVLMEDTDFYSHLKDDRRDFDLSGLVAFEVEYLYVKSTQRSMGIGKKLISKVIEDYNLESNAFIIELWALRSAINFYKKFGFKDDLDDNSQPVSTYMYLD